ncbi:hypothetical protein EYF80_001973 [Liparis tanakae]|uniref:Uncharacterized protein n=1 Tax=Liparis tanakae TaxID=230148 RepID=A0A4Z2JBP9_9TELE|nr:hypothetical protein EYF80_001973 [Liparis tanakae]
MVASSALVPLVASSSTAFTVFSSDVTALQLVHRWIICCLAGGTLGGADELSQRLSHILYSVYENHLEKGHRLRFITTQ